MYKIDYWRSSKHSIVVKPLGLFFNNEDEIILNEIQKWSEENRCGIRTSFDEFYFDNEKEITIFLLKWC